MFVQVIQGKVSDPAKVQAAVDRWQEDVRPGAIGYLGSTGGITDNGDLIVVARFESEELARQNGDRPEQDAWWRQMEGLFTDAPTFKESNDVILDTPGDPDQAGFVQVMQGQTTDPDRARELMNDDSFDFRSFRPDILGTVNIGHEGGDWTMVAYFTSEEAARAGEQKEMPPELQAMMEELNKLSVGEPKYYDLKDPWLR
jgi:hypothetical protein